MLKLSLLSLVITVLSCGPMYAKGKAGLVKEQKDNNDSDNKRKDVQGVIWKYKVMEHDEKDRSERTKMTGRLRIKQPSPWARESIAADLTPSFGSYIASSTSFGIATSILSPNPRNP